jgi:hypothetical protein
MEFAMQRKCARPRSPSLTTTILMLAAALFLVGCGGGTGGTESAELSQYCPQGLVETLAVSTSNHPPHTYHQLIYSNDYSSIAITLYACDPDTPESVDGILWSIDQLPVSGSLSSTSGTYPDGVIDYQPSSGFVGTDCFLYYADDGNARSRTAEICVRIYPVVWSGSFGGPGTDEARTVRQTPDGGFILGGSTDSFGSGLTDSSLVRVNPDGSVAWQNTYGGIGEDLADWVVPLDDGYILAGETYSFITTNEADAWVLYLNLDGTVRWSILLGGNNHDGATAIQEVQTSSPASTRTFIATGYTRSLGGGKDAWLFEIDEFGTVLWQRAYSTKNPDDTFSMPLQQLSGGNLLIAGFSRPTVPGNQMDAWIMKLDAAGNLVWSATYGDSNTDEALAIEQASDGSIIVAGNTHAVTNGNQDGWLLKLDGDTGNPIWQMAVTGGAEDAFSTIREVSPGSYMAAGHTSSYGIGGQDAWIISLNSDGAPAWLKTYGGTGDDRVAALEMTQEGDLILAGSTNSFGDGSEDSWVFRIDSSGDLLDQGAVITEITDPAVFQSTSIPAIANSITAVDTLFTATDITQDVIVTTSSLIPTSNGGP